MVSLPSSPLNTYSDSRINARDGLGGIDAKLIGHVRVQRQSVAVIAKVAGIIGSDFGILLYSEPLPVRGRAEARSPDGTDRQPMMKIDQHAIGGLQRFRSQAPLAHVTEHFEGDAIGAVA